MKCVELDIKREIFGGGHTKPVPGMARFDVKRAGCYEKSYSAARKANALVIFFIINRGIEYRCQMEKNRFIDVFVFIGHLVAVDSKDFANSLD